ncbi:MAG: NUDIX hydrolase [Anaerolineae bacterium]|nr:NUDIX hydrolase [Anaerolineae bacterium]
MTSNERIEALLAAHQPADEKESADMQTIKRMLSETDNLMDRHYPTGHVTGSALVLDAGSGRFLLHFHKKLSRWLQFGGHAEAEENDPAQTALREAREESGLPDLRLLSDQPLDIDVHVIPARGDQPEHLHLDFRYGLITKLPDALLVGEGESERWRWFTMEEVRMQQIVLDRALWRLIAKATALLQMGQ